MRSAPEILAVTLIFTLVHSFSQEKGWAIPKFVKLSSSQEKHADTINLPRA